MGSSKKSKKKKNLGNLEDSDQQSLPNPEFRKFIAVPNLSDCAFLPVKEAAEPDFRMPESEFILKLSAIKNKFPSINSIPTYQPSPKSIISAPYSAALILNSLDVFPSYKLEQGSLISVDLIYSSLINTDVDALQDDTKSAFSERIPLICGCWLNQKVSPGECVLVIEKKESKASEKDVLPFLDKMIKSADPKNFKVLLKERITGVVPVAKELRLYVRMMDISGNGSPVKSSWKGMFAVIEAKLKSSRFLVRKKMSFVFQIFDKETLVTVDDVFSSRIHSLSELHTVCRIDDSTKVVFGAEDSSFDHTKLISNDIESIGGLQRELDLLESAVHNGYKVLLYGPPGTGKSASVRFVSRKVNAKIFSIDAGDLGAKFVGESEKKLIEIFETAKAYTETGRNAIIFLDEIDAICPSRNKVTDSLHKRLVMTLISLLDDFEDSKDSFNSRGRGQISVVGATNRILMIDDSLRRPGRFDYEVEVSVPSREGRLDILYKLLNSLQCISGVSVEHSDFVVAKIADSSNGYVGADLKAVVREALISAIGRCVEDAENIHVSEFDLETGLSRVKPSALREIAVEVPKVFWQDIGGQKETKARIKETVEWPLKHPEAFERMGIRPPRGILLYGPPGTGKTLLARAIATESSMNFLAVKGPELLSKWVGDSEKALRNVFQKARAASPSVIFFDEIDSIAGARQDGSSGNGGPGGVSNRVLSQLLLEMDGISSAGNLSENSNRVVVVAATNRPDVLDAALLRPGRFDRMLYVGPPDLEARLEIFNIETQKSGKCEMLSQEQKIELASVTEGLTGAEVSVIMREAAMLALEEDPDAVKIEFRHLKESASKVKPRVSPEEQLFYERFRDSKSVVFNDP